MATNDNSEEKVEHSPDDVVESGAEVEHVTVGNDAANKFLASVANSDVIVHLSTGTEYRGILDTVDGYFNVTLKNTKEVYNENVVAEYGDVFIKGGLVNYIATA